METFSEAQKESECDSSSHSKAKADSAYLVIYERLHRVQAVHVDATFRKENGPLRKSNAKVGERAQHGAERTAITS